jgi:hypothetical protein
MSSKKDKSMKKKLTLNKKELQSILKLLRGQPNNTKIKIKSVSSGIGDKITVKFGDSAEEQDVSDYDTW